MEKNLIHHTALYLLGSSRHRIVALYCASLQSAFSQPTQHNQGSIKLRGISTLLLLVYHIHGQAFQNLVWHRPTLSLSQLSRRISTFIPFVAPGLNHLVTYLESFSLSLCLM